MGQGVSSKSFSKSHRLLNAKDFQAVFNDAPFRASHPSLLLLARPGSGPHPRLGLVIAKKQLRLAVERNRVKRHLRESFRLLQDQLGHMDIIALGRSGLKDLDDAELRRLIGKQWQRLVKKAATPPAEKPS